MKDQPLKVSIEDDELVIRVGIDVIAFAANESDDFRPYDIRAGDWVQKYKVTDSLEFSKDVVRAMLDEDEDGSSQLTRFLDRMDKSALYSGSMGVDYDYKGKP